MKMIVAVIRQHKLEDVLELLNEIGVNGITTSDVRGYGRQKGHKEMYRGAEIDIKFIPKIKLEIAVSSTPVEKVVEAIQKSARSTSGKAGDGKIFVYDIESVVRISTGETDTQAI